ncbi:MAG: hypothetical protein ACQKBY_09770 [Verrucomicrobiales bacterium]
MIRAYYWGQDSMMHNFGDFAAEVLLNELSESWQLDGNTPTHFVCGSLLDEYFFRQFQPEIAWGCGAQGKGKPDLSKTKVPLVRGPLSRDWLGLPKDTPLGDSLLILPSLFNPPPVKRSPAYFPHWEDIIGASPEGLNPILPLVKNEDEWEQQCDELLSSEFVLCGSLHAAVVRHAFGLPWAWCPLSPERIALPFRWLDWFAYLGVRPEYVTSLEHGRIWWDRNRSKMRWPDQAELISTLPENLQPKSK